MFTLKIIHFRSKWENGNCKMDFLHNSIMPLSLFLNKNDATHLINRNQNLRTCIDHERFMSVCKEILREGLFEKPASQYFHYIWLVTTNVRDQD